MMTRRLSLVLALILLSAGCSRFHHFDLRRPQTLSLQAPAHFLVRFETTKGSFDVEVNREWSPLGADRFYNLVRAKFYDGCRFFRVLPNFVVQFGISVDPAVSKAWKKTEIKDDPVKESNKKWTLAFATDGPNTRTTQLFINKRDNTAGLDRRGFSVFGKVTRGTEVIEKIESKYGEGAPRGKGPEQDRMENEGDAYIQKEYPDMDRIVRARVISQK